MFVQDIKDTIIPIYTTDGMCYKMYLGAAGVIGKLQTDEDKDLLSPSFMDEKTDRVIQWTLWSNTLKNKITTLPEFEWRYNLTQAGDFAGKFNTTVSSSITTNADETIIKVLSTPTLNWKSEQQGHFRGGVKAMTMYKIHKEFPYAINISRYILVDTVYLDNMQQSLGDVYLEAWTPVKKPIYNAVAMSFTDSSDPKWWYNMDNLPTYPNFKLEETNGYIVAFNNEDRSGEAFALVYGKENLNPEQGKVVVNTMQWDTGIGLLPAFSINDLQHGDLVEMNYAIILNRGLNKNFIDKVEEYVPKVTGQNVYTNCPKNTVNSILRTMSCLTNISSEPKDHCLYFRSNGNDIINASKEINDIYSELNRM
jgi:hypothetical protein